jgi:hypothetical protein
LSQNESGLHNLTEWISHWTAPSPCLRAFLSFQEILWNRITMMSSPKWSYFMVKKRKRGVVRLPCHGSRYFKRKGTKNYI